VNEEALAHGGRGLLDQKETKLENLAGNPEHSVLVDRTFFNTTSTGMNNNK